jgi:hypothetical protein
MRQTFELMVSAHMDDFKATAPMERLQWLHALLKKEFGDDVKNAGAINFHLHGHESLHQ